MSQVPCLRGLRGLGMSEEETAARNAAIKAASRTAPVSTMPSAAAAAAAVAAAVAASGSSGVDPGAQEEVDRANEAASVLNVTNAPLAARPGRVSPLSVSWGMPLQTQPIRSSAKYSPKVDPVLIGGGVVLGVVALYLILGD